MKAVAATFTVFTIANEGILISVRIIDTRHRSQQLLVQRERKLRAFAKTGVESQSVRKKGVPVVSGV